MANKEMELRAPPQPPGVAHGVVIAAIAGFIIFVALMMTGIFFYLKSAAPGVFKAAVHHAFPEPRLQETPQSDLGQYERAQRAKLMKYGWVDRSKGIIQIPIEDAMRIVAARGDHAYDPPDPPASAPDPAHPDGVKP